MLLAVIPAAGHSTRMGRPKLSLPLGDRTVLEWTIGSLKCVAGCEALVVIGPHTPELARLVEKAGAHLLQLEHPTPDMRATVEAGLDWLEKRFAPAPNDAWLLCPADVPMVEPGVIRQLAMDSRGSGGVRIPTHAGKRGHPALIGWRHVAGIRAFPAGRGLNEYFRQCGIIEVPVDSDTILLDLDLPEDYARLRERLAV